MVLHRVSEATTSLKQKYIAIKHFHCIAWFPGVTGWNHDIHNHDCLSNRSVQRCNLYESKEFLLPQYSDGVWWPNCNFGMLLFTGNIRLMTVTFSEKYPQRLTRRLLNLIIIITLRSYVEHYYSVSRRWTLLPPVMGLFTSMYHLNSLWERYSHGHADITVTYITAAWWTEANVCLCPCPGEITGLLEQTETLCWVLWTTHWATTASRWVIDSVITCYRCLLCFEKTILMYHEDYDVTYKLERLSTA